MKFRYGIEHELALTRSDGRFADDTDLSFTLLQAVVDALPEDRADYPDLRIGDQGIKHKRWYIEGYERFDEAGGLVRCDPRAWRSAPGSTTASRAAVAAVCADVALLDAELAGVRPAVAGDRVQPRCVRSTRSCRR